MNGINATGLIGIDGDLLGLGVEGDGQVISTSLSNRVLVVRTSGPAGCPACILNHLELNQGVGIKINALLCPGVNTVGKGHVVGSIAGSPLSAEQSSGSTSNGVEVITGLNKGSLNINSLGLGIEGDLHVVVAVLSNGFNHVIGRISDSPAVVLNNLERNATSGESDIVLGEGVEAFNKFHVVVGVSSIPLGAEDSSGNTCHGVGVNIGVRNFLNEIQSTCNVLGVGVEGDGHVVDALGGNRLNIVLTGISLTPGVVDNHLERDRTGGELNVLLGPGVEAVNEGHVVVCIAGSPLGAEQGSGSTSYGVSVATNGRLLKSTVNLEFAVGLIVGHGVRLALNTHDVVSAIVTASLLGLNPIGIFDLQVATGGANTHGAVELIPGCAAAVSKHKINDCRFSILGNGHLVGIGTVASSGHLITAVESPAAQRAVTHNVDCRIGVQANEGKHN